MAALRTLTDAEARAEIERARKDAIAKRKDGADRWEHIGTLFDPNTGVEQEIWYNHETSEVGGRLSDRYLGEILDSNREQYVANLNQRHRAGETMRKVASIPLGFLFGNWQHAIVENDHEFIRKKLNDPDYRAFRTAPGKL
jgi:hypothetical protein